MMVDEEGKGETAEAEADENGPIGDDKRVSPLKEFIINN
jgi:hypothetical protein